MHLFPRDVRKRPTKLSLIFTALTCLAWGGVLFAPFLSFFCYNLKSLELGSSHFRLKEVRSKISILLETSGGILFSLEGFRYPSWGIINPQEGYLNPSSGIINPQEGYLNPSSGIINPQKGELNPSSGIIYPREG